MIQVQFFQVHTSSCSCSSRLRLAVLELLQLGLAEVVDEARADRVPQHVDRRPEPERKKGGITQPLPCFNVITYY